MHSPQFIKVVSLPLQIILYIPSKMCEKKKCVTSLWRLGAAQTSQTAIFRSYFIQNLMLNPMVDTICTKNESKVLKFSFKVDIYQKTRKSTFKIYSVLRWFFQNPIYAMSAT